MSAPSPLPGSYGITGKPFTRVETSPGDHDVAQHSAELLDPEVWSETLTRFGSTMKVAVALTDIHGNLLGECHNAQPVWSLARKGMVERGHAKSTPECPFCLLPSPPCAAVEDALARGEITYVSDPAGLAHAAIPLFLGDRPLGALLAGQTFAGYPQPLALQRVARRFGISNPALWNTAMRQVPVSRATLILYADLLETLGDAFLQQQYARILDRNLHKTNHRYRLMIEGSNDRAVFTVDDRGIVTSWNSGAQHLLGYTESEIIGNSYSRFFTPEDIRSATPRSGIRLAQQNGWTEEERWQVRKDGTRFLSEIVMARLGSGDELEYGRLLHDVTEQRKSLEAALQAQKLESIGVLAGGIAHDFNNLLTGILGNIDLALDMLPPDEAARPMLDTAQQASLQAAELVSQLLVYAGKSNSITRVFDLSELVTKILPLIETSIPKSVQLELNLLPGLPWIDADPRDIQQVIMNLVINGAEAFGPAGGMLRVSTGLADADGGTGESRVCFTVQDTGCGMDQATKARIFEPFFTTKFVGRGLGLAAVSGIVQRAKASLDVVSMPGEGSTFRIVFPGKAAPSPVANVVAKRDSRGAGLILVVDDETMIRLLARSVLERNGYSVLTAENGREGVNVFRENAPAITAVLLDLMMPVMGGVEALRLMHEIRPDVPVIISSGYAENEVRTQFSSALAGVINKPYTASMLCDKVAAVLTSRATA